MKKATKRRQKKEVMRLEERDGEEDQGACVEVQSGNKMMLY